ncbi:MAG: helix-turn-helix domain-containing protein [Sphingomonadales bacterium]|nr:helix-turn-helix domain-containing protein [Sphingomonadales bacterium]
MKLNSIYIAEAHDSLRGLLAEHLRSEYFVRDFARFSTAVRMMEEAEPDLFIFSLPDDITKSLESLQEYKRSPKFQHIPILILAGQPFREVQAACYGVGADVCLERPFGLTQLNPLVASLLRNREASYAHARRRSLLPASYSSMVMEDEFFMQKVNRFLGNNIRELNLYVSKVAEEMSMSISQFDRRVTRLTGQTPNQYIREYRMRVAYELLASRRGNVSEIAMMTGFKSISYFSSRFRERFGFAPSFVRSGRHEEVVKETGTRGPQQAA